MSFFIKFEIHTREKDFKWILFSVYDVAQQELKEVFLLKFSCLCAKEIVPIVIDGDFNIKACHLR
jgi:hypothetical protein